MLLEASQTVWVGNVTSGIVATVIGGLIVLAVQLIASPPAERVHLDVRSITIETVEARVVRTAPPGDAKDAPPGPLLIGGLIGLFLFYFLFWAVVGLTVSLAVVSLLLLAWCVLKTMRFGLWTAHSSVATARILIALLAVAYAWVVLFTFQSAGSNWESFVRAATGEGEGAAFVQSAITNFITKVMSAGPLLAVSLTASALLSSLLLAMSLVTLFRWVAFLSFAYGPPRRFAGVRSRAAAAFVQSRPRDLLLEIVGTGLILLLSPPIWLTLFPTPGSATNLLG